MIFLFLSLNGLLSAQGEEFVVGDIGEENAAGDCFPLEGASAFWLGTSAGTFSDATGGFKLQKVEGIHQLIVSYVGYETDTIDTRTDDYFHLHLVSSTTLDEVEVVYKRKTTEISFLDPLKVEQIGEKELLKAACCNLSESFETSPSVDVSFTDAVTGTRQIQMLGLAGAYTQITRENMPHIRGLATIYGLTYVPGHWVKGIQLNKGTGSVLNGFESIAGQINVELRKPEDSEKLYVNLYGNMGGRLEANVNTAFTVKEEKWFTGLLLHGVNNTLRWDRNKDGFLDRPQTRHFIGLNRWRYQGEKGLRSQFAVKGTLVSNKGGQTSYDHKFPQFSIGSWGMGLNLQRLEAWGKIGRVFEETPWKTYGFQASTAYHNQSSFFGLRRYDARQTSSYTNFVYQSIIDNTNHVIKAGASIQYDDYKETLDDTNFDRMEIVPGAYFEYTYTLEEKFSFVAGIRADYHNNYGFFATPRLHLRYAPTEKTVFRASVGRGQRTANIISDNIGILASSRQFLVNGDGSKKPYGLDAEVAWNYGLNITQTFKLNYREGRISADFYRTDFQNQVVLDLEFYSGNALFSNLNGKSYSNSFQIQADYELLKGLDIRLAYRWFDVKTTYRLDINTEELLQKPLVAPHRTFMNIGYATDNNWKFDYTVSYQGKKRIPSTSGNPVQYQRPTESPGFVLMNAQISKSWKENLEIYLGGENLLDFRQTDPIIASDQPFSDSFDASLVWGPVFGRNIYVGLRYKIP